MQPASIKNKSGQEILRDNLPDFCVAAVQMISGAHVQTNLERHADIQSSRRTVGELCTRYDKIHLFGFRKGIEAYDEARTILPGTQSRFFDAPCGCVGMGSSRVRLTGKQIANTK